jgi:predicted DNA-binding transcriptional regulator AlpA
LTYLRRASKLRLMSTSEHLLTAAETAERTGRSPRTIARWAQSGRLPIALRLPGGTGALLFHPADVEALLTPAGSDEAKS